MDVERARSNPGEVTMEDEPRLWTPAFVLLTVADFVYWIAASMMIPVVPLFASGPIGATPTGVGFAVGVFSVAGVLLRPFAGRGTDRRGRKPIMVGGAVLFAVVSMGFILAESLTVLVALRFCQGAAEAAFVVAGFAWLADVAPPSRVGEAISFNSLGLYGGVALGPLVGELLLVHGGYNSAWIGAALLALTAAVLAWRIPEPARDERSTEQRLQLIHRAVIGPGIAMFTALTAMAGFLAFVALRAREVGLDGSQFVLMTFGLTVIGCRIRFAKLADRVPPLRLMAVALGVTTVAMAVASGLPGPIGLFLAAALLAIGVAFTTPAFFAAIMARVTPAERGAAAGTATLFMDLGFGVGPIVFGVAADVWTIPAAFAVGGCIAAAGCVWALRLAGAVPAERLPQ